MNKTRRNLLSQAYDNLEKLSAIIEEIKDQEEEYRDNIPENLQGSERYEKAEAACDNLESALDALGECLDYIEEAMV